LTNTVPFFKEGNLSPVKQLLRNVCEIKDQGNQVLKVNTSNLVFFRKLLESSRFQLLKISRQVINKFSKFNQRYVKALSRSPLSSPSKLTPLEVKQKLGTVSKLADLQAKLKQLSSDQASAPKSHKRALFGKPETVVPKLSQKPFTFEVEKVKLNIYLSFIGPLLK